MVLLAVVVLKNPKDIFLSHSLSLPKKHERERVLKEEKRVVCARLCRRNAQRERERRVRVTQSDDDDAKRFFLSSGVKGC